MTSTLLQQAVEALRLILPMAKGYAYNTHRVKANEEMCDQAAVTLASLESALQQQEEPREVAAENDAFNEWWESSGQGAEPLHTLTTENCARATWHERARRAASPSPQATQQAMPPEVAEQFAFFKSLAKNPAYYRNRLSKLLAWIESPSPQDFTLPMVEEGKGTDGVKATPAKHCTTCGLVVTSPCSSIGGCPMEGAYGVKVEGHWLCRRTGSIRPGPDFPTESGPWEWAPPGVNAPGEGQQCQ